LTSQDPEVLCSHEEHALRTTPQGHEPVPDLYEDSSYVAGWENAHKALTYNTLDSARTALSWHSEHAAVLDIEPIEMEARPLPDGYGEQDIPLAALVAREMARLGMDPYEADALKEQLKGY
jgi:hypothetical protein